MRNVLFILLLFLTSCKPIYDTIIKENKIYVRDTINNTIIDTIYQTETEIKEITKWRTRYETKIVRDSIKYNTKTIRDTTKHIAKQDRIKEKYVQKTEKSKNKNNNWFYLLIFGVIIGFFFGLFIGTKIRIKL